MKNKVAVSIIVLVLASVMLFAGGSREPDTIVTPEGVEIESKVSMYASITAIESVLDAFEQNVGAKAEYTRVSTARFVSTVLTEFEADRLMADVIQGPLPVLEILRERGVVAPFTPKAVADYPDWAKRDGIYLFGIEYVALIYNTELVAPEDVPRRYEDLTDPKWYNQIVMANPENHATTIAWLVGLKENVFESEAAWREFLHGVAANKPMFVASFGPTPAPIESGEKKIAISMPKYIITKAPAPLGWAQVEDQPIMGSPRAIAMTSKAPNPRAAEAFMEYWLSDEAMGILAEDVGEYVLAPGVYPPIDGIEDAQVIPIRELTDEELQYWGNEFKTIFAVN